MDIFPERRVLVCQYRTCTKDGAGQILTKFQQKSIPNLKVEASGCMGLCGSGPMVMILPDNVYYWQVQPKQVQKIIDQHLVGNQPVKEMMHPRLHRRQ